MLKIIVITDDLTGGNANSILLKKEGINVVTVVETAMDVTGFEAAVYSTNSREIPQSEAFDRVYQLSEKLKDQGAVLFSKRIDSTLRGNLGAEIDAMLEALGEEVIAVCCPAYPDSGRTVNQGVLYVHGQALAQSAIIRERFSETFSSEVKIRLEIQSKLKISQIFLDKIRQDPSSLSHLLDQEIAGGNRIIVCDAVCNDDLSNLAKAITLNKHTIITVDSGFLTAEYAKQKFQPKMPLSEKKVLAVVGSVNPMARQQLEQAWYSSLQVKKILVHTRDLSDEVTRKNEMERILNTLAQRKIHANVLTLVSDGIYAENIIDQKKDMNKTIDAFFAQITRQALLDNPEFRSLYTSGGDTTLAIYKALSAQGIQIIDEVLPLAVYGKLMRGDFHGLHVVTKGGSQGDKYALEKCFRYLFDRN